MQNGAAAAPSAIAKTADSFANEYGGVTAYARAPGRGLGLRGKRTIDRDDIVIFELMLKTVSRAERARRRRALERAFGQVEIVIRSLPFVNL